MQKLGYVYNPVETIEEAGEILLAKDTAMYKDTVINSRFNNKRQEVKMDTRTGELLSDE